MAYRKYFKPDQKLLVTLSEDGREHHETLTMYFVEGSGKHMKLRLPYKLKRGEEHQFHDGEEFDLATESLGLGIRQRARYESYLNESLLQVAPVGNLQVFQRRLHPRVNVKIGIKFVRGTGNLRSFQEQWKKNVKVLEAGTNIASLQNLPVYSANLSAGGLRIPIKGPVDHADLFLILINIEDGKPPVCVLAEAAWTAEPDPKGFVATGLQFLNITDADKSRLLRFVAANDHAREEDDAAEKLKKK